MLSESEPRPYWGKPETRSGELLEWWGVAVMLAVSLLFIGYPLRGLHWAEFGFGLVFFGRAADEIEKLLRGKPRMAEWNGCEITAAGILLPAAGMPLWSGWALALTGLVLQSLYILKGDRSR